MIVSQTPSLRSRPLPAGARNATYACLIAKSEFAKAVPIEVVARAFASGPNSPSNLYPADHCPSSRGRSTLSFTTSRLKPSALAGPPYAKPGRFAFPVPGTHQIDELT